MKEIRFNGFTRMRRVADAYNRGVPFSKKQEMLETLLAEDEIMEVKIDGWRGSHFTLTSDAALLDDLSAGRVPEAWTPLETTTTEEVTFLAPLDPVSARGRAKVVFNFDYVWEVYKPVDKRRYGYYTLPVLWGDRLVARFDSKLDRTTNTFFVLGFWLEEKALGQDEAFAEALARGFKRFRAFLGADQMDATAINPPLLRKRVEGS